MSRIDGWKSSRLDAFSIIIPTLDAASVLARSLPVLQAAGPLEILVVDGGSHDGTPELARQFGCQVVNAPRGRGSQLKAGAGASQGAWLFFLHADTRPGQGWEEALSGFSADPANAARAGYLRLVLDSPAAAARRVERLANWRARRLGLAYGDQGLVIARSFYQALGGYRPLPLMEDVELVRRIGRRRLVELPATVVTSAAKYESDGWWRRPASNLLRLGLYMAGVSPAWLARHYR